MKVVLVEQKSIRFIAIAFQSHAHTSFSSPNLSGVTAALFQFSAFVALKLVPIRERHCRRLELPASASVCFCYLNLCVFLLKQIKFMFL